MVKCLHVGAMFRSHLKIEMEKSTTPTSDTSPSFLVIKRESESSARRLEKE